MSQNLQLPGSEYEFGQLVMLGCVTNQAPFPREILPQPRMLNEMRDLCSADQTLKVI